jgi:hypothetical protein
MTRQARASPSSDTAGTGQRHQPDLAAGPRAEPLKVAVPADQRRQGQREAGLGAQTLQSQEMLLAAGGDQLVDTFGASMSFSRCQPRSRTDPAGSRDSTSVASGRRHNLAAVLGRRFAPRDASIPM